MIEILGWLILLLLGSGFCYRLFITLNSKAAPKSSRNESPLLSLCKDGKVSQLKRELATRGEGGKRRRIFALDNDATLLDENDGNDPLMIATKEGNAACVELLLEHIRQHQFEQPAEGFYSIPNRRVVRYNTEGWAAAHLACIAGREDLLALFIQDDKARELQAKEKGAEQKVPRWLDFRAKQNGWTALHVLAAQGHEGATRMAIKAGADVDVADMAGHTPLIIASCNGHVGVVQLLIDAGADIGCRTERGLDSALQLAAKNGHEEVLKRLLDGLATRECTRVDKEEQRRVNPLFFVDAKGASLLHAACVSGKLSVVRLLLEKRIGKTKGLKKFLLRKKKTDGCTALHVAALRGKIDVVEYLVQLKCDVAGRSTFGTTCLHEACARGNAEVAKALIQGGADVMATDNDGFTPMHTACGRRGINHLEIIKLLQKAGADINAKDTGDATPLHVLVFSGDETVEAVQYLLENGADYQIENVLGWTPLRCAYSEAGSLVVAKAIEDYIKKDDPKFLETFDKTKPRDLTRAKVAVANRSVLDMKEKFDVLDGDVSLKGIAKKIQAGKIKKVVVMTGAGISVSAGIPDFRSSTGLYSTQNPNLSENAEKLKAKYKLPSLGATFDLHAFRADPAPFYAVVKELFLPVVEGKFKPTLTHWFIRMLHDKGLLLRNYSQNIDMLENAAGIPEEAIVEAHGSFSRARCTAIECGKFIEDLPQFWNEVQSDKVPLCPHCGAVARPDIVFFGEALPKRFLELRTSDLKDCDLLIVAGTSLLVYPFAGLANEVQPTTPRLLFNRDSVGVWRAIGEEPKEKENEKEEGQEGGDEEKEKETDIQPTNAVGNYRDVQVLGDCDDGVMQLARLLGWEEDLLRLAASKQQD